MTSETKQKKKWIDWWYCILLVLILLQLSFYIVPQFRPGILGLIFWFFGCDSLLWMIIGFFMLSSVAIWGFFRKKIWDRRRITSCVLVVVLVISPMAFRVYPSSYDDKPSSVHFQLPLDGPVTVAWGGSTPNVNYHVMAPDQRWAYDLVVTKDGKTHQGKGKKCEDYYCYGLPILAPAGGLVHAVSDGDPDMPIGKLGGGTTPAGNHIVLQVIEDQYLFICHMQPGSIAVKPGDLVAPGQMIGRVGNSGNTSEPHIHLHLQQGSFPFLAEGIPMYFYHYRCGDKIVEKGIPEGGVSKGLWSGQVIEDVGEKIDK